MMKTSFGELEILLKDQNKPRVEYLKFHKSGRSHLHPEYESFFTMKGTGVVVSGEQRIDVKPGDLVTVPPNTPHWMEPTTEGFEGLLWYHAEPIKRP